MNWKTHVTAALDGEHPVLGRSIALALQVLIILSGISIGVETLPNVPPQMDVYFEYEEAVIVGIFTVEYILRVVAAERPLAYVTSVLGIIDLLAVLPYYLSLGLDLRSIRTFRLLRMLQLLKYARYSAAANRIGRALRGCFRSWWCSPSSPCC